ncbi:ABC transporter [Vibrio sp. qd031]|uniref:ABC transporter permease n=1 Tax=Vibrio sp. qd031 TaxID=1603038 RepID=UPI000A0F9993|nr:ABC transporter permease [Vibrio sp. qd031]ORT51879.1 ABC transporter [Vibrio sp. qd031]
MTAVNKRSTLQVWKDVIFAIFLREIKSKSNDKFGVAWQVVNPVAFIMMLSFLRGRLDGGETHTIPTFFFMLYGILLVQSFLGILSASAGAIKKNKPLYAFRQVQPISSIIAISGLELLVKFVVVLVLLLICYLLRLEIVIADPLTILGIFTKVWLISTSIGVLFGLATCYVPEIQKIQSLATRPIFFISGIFFSLQDIPREYWSYLNWNPLLHAVELCRYAAYPSYGNEGVSLFYLDACTLVLTFFALACYHISWKQAISR